MQNVARLAFASEANNLRTCVVLAVRFISIFSLVAAAGVAFGQTTNYSIPVGPGTLSYQKQTTSGSCPIGPASGGPPPMGNYTAYSFGGFLFTAPGVNQSLSGGTAYISSPGGNYGCPPSGWQTAIPLVLSGTGYTISFTPSLGGPGSATYVATTPSISSISPTSGSVGTSVTITGTNFGATQGSSTVKFNGTTATPSSWSSTQIIAPVPAGATTGPITVTTSGGQATSPTFTVSNTLISLGSSPNPSAYGVAVTFSATVTPTNCTGQVTFKDGGTSLGTGTLSSGTATYSTSTLAVGTHSITASYGGGGSCTSVTSSALSQTVNRSSSASVALASSRNPSSYGDCVTLTATVTPTAATGTVSFNDGSTGLGTSNLSNGVATLSSCWLGGGSHSIVGAYSGDANYTASSSPPLSQTVNKATSTVALSASPNPSLYGSAVTFTATLTPGATGTVTFKEGTTTLGTATISNGTVIWTTRSLTVGPHSITASYGGDANYLSSTSSALSQTVNDQTEPCE